MNKLYLKIEKFVSTLDVNSITEERKAMLQPLVDFVKEKVEQRQPIRLNFVCTHNSRRSHLTQIWAQTMAFYNGINVQCYSAGTDATALFPMVAETLRNTGFEIEQLSTEANPVYAIKHTDSELPIIGFSKTVHHQFNPKSGFATIMTCSHADANCPFVPGAEKRISITYEDPKVSDGTPQQAQAYAERSTQIATEMLYVFLNVR